MRLCLLDSCLTQPSLPKMTARTPAGGRNWEMASADPYLTGESAFHTTKGMQDAGVQACAKHYIANEQVRRPFLSYDWY